VKRGNDGSHCAMLLVSNAGPETEQPSTLILHLSRTQKQVRQVLAGERVVDLHLFAKNAQVLFGLHQSRR
jgi:hypothetical protein